MQFKPVPEPPETLETLASVRAALPADADPAVDCCARVIERTAVDDRDAAANWVTFLRALELAAAEPDGYRRATVEGSLDAECLADAFRERVAGVDVALRALDPDEPRSAGTVADLAADATPGPDRSRGGDRRPTVSTDRVERLLEWAALFALVERVDGAYRPA